jgi:hypothetical protein
VVNEKTYSLSFTREELAFLSNAIGESFEAVEDWEYQTRVGGTKEELEAIRARISALYQQAKNNG